MTAIKTALSDARRPYRPEPHMGIPMPTQPTIEGWIRTSRFSKRVTFLEVYDGSSDETLQVVVKPAVSPELKARLGVGAAVRITGMMEESKGAEQDYELVTQPDRVEVVGDCDPSEFPIQKKEASQEFLRTIPHLRVRTAEFQRIFLIRDLISRTIHQHLGDEGFMWVHTPIITYSDCEGAGEMFSVSSGEEPFFGEEAFLTVSGQLEVEPFALAFSKVYTFGPTFRAEPSHTSRHASEFWMVEPEIAFASLHDVMELAESLLKVVIRKLVEKGLGRPEFESWFKERWRAVTHKEAVKILQKADRKWEFKPKQGMSLQSEHEKYLAELAGGPVFITHYPADQKPFYMRTTRPQKGKKWDGTVECFDLLVPGIGEVIGGSAREEDEAKLAKALGCHGLDPEVYDWYLDLRRFGSVPHGGFGIGLERLVMWLADVKNIRDATPYPRTPA